MTAPRAPRSPPKVRPKFRPTSITSCPWRSSTPAPKAFSRQQPLQSVCMTAGAPSPPLAFACAELADNWRRLNYDETKSYRQVSRILGYILRIARRDADQAKTWNWGPHETGPSAMDECRIRRLAFRRDR